MRFTDSDATLFYLFILNENFHETSSFILTQIAVGEWIKFDNVVKHHGGSAYAYFYLDFHRKVTCCVVCY